MKRLLSLSGAMILATALHASDANIEKRLEMLEGKVEKLSAENNVLTEELTSLESEKWYQSVDVSKSQSGMGAAASKVYYSQNPLSIGGYGEVYYTNPSNKDAYTDVYRFIPYIGYKFSDNIILNTEIEFEHGGDKVLIEFLYLDFILNKYANIRVGQQLVPVGLINLRHEPTLFPTVLRPETETYVIPSTWNELGVTLYGETETFAYQFGIINALNFDSEETRSGALKWIKNARRGSKEKIAAREAAFTGRIDYTGIEGLKTGVSLYYGDGTNVKGADIDGTSMFLYDLHASYKQHAFGVNLLWTEATLSGAGKIGGSAAKKAEGFYANASYNIFSILGKPTLQMPLFYQYENYNPVKESVDGTNTFQDITSHTFGLNYFPHEQVVFKAEYQVKDDKNIQDDTIKTASLSFGFIF